ncbi:MAG: thioredoxin family protein [Bacteroidales bacterium]|nr:thioredoxin family protein [Bacteroidales bacterium]
MKKTLSAFFLALFISFSFTLNAQLKNHTNWSFTTEKISQTEVMLIFDVTIDDGWHLYSPNNPPGGALPLVFNYNSSPNYELSGKIIEIPKPTVVYDDIFSKDEYFFSHTATFKQKIKVLSETDFTLSGELDGQVCLEDGSCINFTKDYTFSIKGVTQTANNQNNNPENNTNNNIENNTNDNIDLNGNQASLDTINVFPLDTVNLVENENVDTTARIISFEPTGTTPILVTNNSFEGAEANRSLFWFFIVAFLLGLAALLTPCVFPMIPMTISFFIKGEKSKKGKWNAVLYGLNIVAIYTLPIAIIIIIAQIFGSGDSISGDFASFLSTHWIPNILFFLIFMVFAASFFGAFEITLPHWMVNKTSQKSGQGGFLGLFFMAFTLVLVSFSCTGPIVGAVLVESTQGGLILKPLVGMLGFSMGVALPFTLFAIFPSWLDKLPKSGGWLNSVKVVLGFVEIALGLKFLSIADQTYHWGILNREIYLAIWIVVFALMGFYLLGKLKFAHDTETKHVSIPRLIFAIITFSFVVYMIPGIFGAPLKELSGYLPPKSTQDFDIERLATGKLNSNLCEKPLYQDELHMPHGLQGYYDVYQALNCSKEIGKPIFIDFTGHGCVNCRKMEENVWSDPRVLKILNEDYIVLSLFVDDKTIEAESNRWFTSIADGKVKKDLGKQNADIQIVNFNVNSQPLYALVDYKGNVLAPTREFDTDIEAYIKFLEEGKKQYKLLHPVK